MHQKGALTLSLLLGGCADDPRAVEVALGAAHSCALDDAGEVWCWGAGVREPELVEGLPAVTAITAGQGHTCALADDASVWCWGSGERGQLGSGTTSSAIPLTVPDVQATAIAAGDLHTCMLSAAGEVSCWGDNATGQLGIAASEEPITTPVLAIDGASAIAAGGIDGVSRSCGIRDGAVWCWGRLEAPAATTLDGAAQIDVGADHFCAVGEDAALSCVDAFVDDALAKLSGTTFRHVSAGGLHSCALATDGAVWCFGDDLDGQLGDGSADSTGGAVKAIDGAVAIGVGALHSCAVVQGGGVRCWGENNNGRLGNGETGTSAASPVTVVGFGD